MDSKLNNSCVPRVRFACLRVKDIKDKELVRTKQKWRRENLKAWLRMKHQFSLAVVEA